ncbi:calcium-activated potassium channel subunit beta-4-like [Ptychodera flava]|uniref:calcium-activated potassium channel subunit beta-4-like n=1 Tax=Ptychodera flava TaxID=63121 RepID=UPI00396A45B4
MAGRKSKKRESACSCAKLAPRLILSWMLLSLIVLAFLSWFIVKPAIQDKRFKKANCTVYSVQYRNEWQGCRCGRYCWSQFPCVQIFVKYHAENVHRRGHYETGLAHEDETNLNTYPQCSYDICSGVEYRNEEHIADYVSRHNIKGSTFPCFYNPENKSQVLMNEIFNNKAILHAILWPLLSFLSSVLAAFLAYRKFYRNDGNRKKANSRSNSRTTYKRFSDPVPL